MSQSNNPYKDKLNALPDDEQLRKEQLDDLKIEAALEHDREVDSDQLKQWLDRAKQGPKVEVHPVKQNSWVWIAASFFIAVPVVSFVVISGVSSVYEPTTSSDENKITEKAVTVVAIMEEEEIYSEIEELKELPTQGVALEPVPVAPKPVVRNVAPMKQVSKEADRSESIPKEDASIDMIVLNDIAPAEKVVTLENKTYSIRTPSAVAGVRGTQASTEPIGQLGLELHDAPIAANKPSPLMKKSAKVRSPRFYVDGKISGSKLSFDDQVTQGETYHPIQEKGFVLTEEDPKSTISIDVDTASYSNLRKLINSGTTPPSDAVRLEEMVNYFVYPYSQPEGETPFSVTSRLEPCPWNVESKILHIGLQGKSVLERPKANLVFLLDVSGSMKSSDKLPLLKRAFKLMLNNLNLDDKVGIVAYAGHTGVVLDSTSVKERSKIDNAIDRLVSSGSTNGQGGIQLAYRLAKDHFIQDGINRVILATDGDFNVGTSNVKQLEKLIEEKRKTGVELSVLGFGRGNIRDDIMERLANHGNGNYAYIDTISEARKALVSQLSSTLVTIAKDVKLQLQFNPEVVESFRQIGYENRTLAHKDFNDDTKDAGEIGAGHTVTALYEIKFKSNEASKLPGTLLLRYKRPGEDKSILLEHSLNEGAEVSNKITWASVVAAFGQKLRGSQYVNSMKMSEVLELAQKARGEDPYGYRSEAIKMMQQIQDLDATSTENAGDYPKWKFRE